MSNNRYVCVGKNVPFFSVFYHKNTDMTLCDIDLINYRGQSVTPQDKLEFIQTYCFTLHVPKTLLQRTIIFGLALYKQFCTHLRIDAIQKHANVFYNPTTIFFFCPIFYVSRCYMLCFCDIYVINIILVLVHEIEK